MLKQINQHLSDSDITGIIKVDFVAEQLFWFELDCAHQCPLSLSEQISFHSHP